MPHIEWVEGLEVGIEEIDQQHHNLVRLINAVDERRKKGGLRDSANKIIYTLLAFAKFHFRTEETLMIDYDYPGYQKQKDEHEQMLARLEKFHGKAEKGETVDYFTINNFLCDWFLRHLSSSDMKYVDYFVKYGAAREVERAKKTKKKSGNLSVGPVELIIWGRSYDFGIDEIDDQHRLLADAINEVYETLKNPWKKDTIESSLEKLKDYAGTHFNREEELMVKHYFKGINRHKDEHMRFRFKVEELRTKFRKHKTVVDHDIIMALKDWFLNHTQVEDRKYIPYLLHADAKA